MKQLLNFLLAVLVTVSLALVPGCGVRKVQDNKSETLNSSKDESKSSGSVGKESSSGGTSGNKEVKDKTDEAQNSKVTELYYENGQLKQRITELQNFKTVDKSTNEINSTWYINTKTDSIFNNYIKSERTITIRIHTRDLDRNSTWVENLGGSWVIIVIAIIFCLLFLSFCVLKGWINNPFAK